MQPYRQRTSLTMKRTWIHVFTQNQTSTYIIAADCKEEWPGMSFKPHTCGLSSKQEKINLVWAYELQVAMSEYLRRQPFSFLGYFPSLSLLPFGYLSFLSAPMFGRVGRRLRTVARGAWIKNDWHEWISWWTLAVVQRLSSSKVTCIINLVEPLSSTPSARIMLCWGILFQISITRGFSAIFVLYITLR